MGLSVRERRLQALVELEVLDAPAEELFDRVAALAASLTGRSMAAVSLSDDRRQFFLAEIGVGTREVPAELAFCRFAVDGPAAGFEIADTTLDDRFSSNPLVTRNPGIRTYAGVPLTMTDGIPVGTLCVMDTRPGVLSGEERRALRTLADVVAQLMQTRKVARNLATTLQERDAAQERTRAALRQMRTVFDGVPTGLVLTDSAGVVQQVNPAFVEMVGGVASNYLARPWIDLVSDDERSSELALLDDVHQARRSTVVREVTLTRHVGGPALVLASTSVARKPDGTVGSVVSRIEDIASRRQAEIELREAQSALDGIITVDGDQRIVSWNEGATRLLGYDRGTAVGKDLSLIIPASSYAEHHQGFTRLHHGGQPRLLAKTVELEAVTAGGTLLPVELSLTRWYRGQEPFYTAVIRDISERRAHEAEVHWRATHDAATGLPNMGALNAWFDEHCATLDDGRPRAVFCLQLTNLSSVSAALKADASARLLQQIGTAFAATARADFAISHLRDTHFGGAVAMDADPHPATLHDRLTEIARYVTEAGTGPYLVDGVRVEIHVQMGVVATRRGDLTFLELLRQAEATRDSSARQINIAEEIFAAAGATAARDLVTLSDLRDAVPGGQLELHYQPLTPLQPAPVDYGTAPTPSAPQLVEALVRWHHPTRGLVAPDEFIPLIETSRMIYDVTEWVLREALTQQTQWRDAGLDVRVAVNVSPQVLLNDDIVALVIAALSQTGANPDRLKIEITESAIVHEPDQARDIVANLRRLGVHVSLDDFGTGYTSLRLLRDLAVDEIKLDRLFVAHATTNPADAAIANAVGQLGQRLGIRTVAEGIEEAETRNLFRALGFDYMQGYLDSRPLPAHAAAQWLLQHQPHIHPQQAVGLPNAPALTSR